MKAGCTRTSMRPARVVFADREQFEDVAELFAVGDVQLADARDALAVDLVQRHLRVEGETGEDGQLVRRVEALDVRRGVLLGIAERLRVFEDGGIVQTFARHAGEDIVGRAVDDARQRVYDVRLHPVGQGADDGDAAHAARLEVQPRVGAARRALQLVPVFAEELFVGGDDRLAAVQRREDEALGGFDAADHFHDDVHVGVADHLGDVVGDLALLDAEIERALFVEL